MDRTVTTTLDIVVEAPARLALQVAIAHPSLYTTESLLAPRSALVRIATGRDAADTALLSNYGGLVPLEAMSVTATSAGNLPTDNVRALTWLN